MKEADRLERNTQRLTELYDPMAAVVRRVLDTLQEQGFRPRIQSAFRSLAAQLEAYNSGHAMVKFGFHNVSGAHGAMESLACDVLDDDDPLSPGTRYLLALAVAARRHGLTTGITWGLAPAVEAGVEAAIAAHDLDRSVKVGWDPTHVQPVGISISQAKAGRRPAFGAAAAPAPGHKAFHTVVRNETLSGIAKQHHLTLARILVLNPAKVPTPNLVLVGEKIRVS
jgi:hypothetical protein